MCTAPSWRKWEDVRYSTFLGRRHKSRWTHSRQTRSQNKMVVFLELFSRFRRGTENRGFNWIQIFLAEVFQITSRFVLRKINFGVRCTLRSPKQSVVYPSLFYKLNMRIKRVSGHTKRVGRILSPLSLYSRGGSHIVIRISHWSLFPQGSTSTCSWMH